MLSWSHAVLYVQTLQPMLQFYSEVLGFLITDRGPLAEGAPEIVFLSQDPSLRWWQPVKIQRLPIQSIILRFGLPGSRRSKASMKSSKRSVA